jgi:hypothetical protein
MWGYNLRKPLTLHHHPNLKKCQNEKENYQPRSGKPSNAFSASMPTPAVDYFAILNSPMIVRSPMRASALQRLAHISVTKSVTVVTVTVYFLTVTIALGQL